MYMSMYSNLLKKLVHFISVSIAMLGITVPLCKHFINYVEKTVCFITYNESPRYHQVHVYTCTCICDIDVATFDYMQIYSTVCVFVLHLNS